MDQFLFMCCSGPGPDFNPGPDFIHFSPGPSPSPDFTNIVRVQILSMASPGQSPDFILVRIRILYSFESGSEILSSNSRAGSVCVAGFDPFRVQIRIYQECPDPGPRPNR